MDDVERVARALCRTQFASEIIHGDARCCQLGGIDGCCLPDLKEQAVAAIAAMQEALIHRRSKNGTEANEKPAID